MLEINEGLIKGEEIHRVIESKTQNYSLWIRRAIDYADLKEDKDFFTKLLKSTGGRPKTELLFTVEAAKEICLLERNEKGKQIRRWLILLGNQHESGLSFTSEQILSLIELSKSMTLVSIQKEVEKKHFALYNDKYTWYKYRAELLGYSTDTLIKAMQEVNKKYKSIRKSLIQLDSCELIRTGVIDFMIALGKTKEYAINTGNLCKKMAEKMELGNQIWNDESPNPLKLNMSSIIEKKESFRKQLK